MTKEVKVNSKDVEVKDGRLIIKDKEILNKIESENELCLDSKEGQNWAITFSTK